MNDPKNNDWLLIGPEGINSIEYDYRIHKFTALSPGCDNINPSPTKRQASELLRSLERCLLKADKLNLKLVGLKLNEARDVLKDDAADL